MLVCLACYGDRVAALLETSTDLHLYRAEGQDLVPDGTVAAFAGDTPALIRQLTAAKVDLLICGGVTCCSQEALLGVGVHVLPWIGGAADEVAQAWTMGCIQHLKMPGCGRKRRQCCGRNITREIRDMSQTIIAVTSEGPKLTDLVDPRFGRAAGFVVVDLATNVLSYIDNGGSLALAQGAGIQAAENVARAGAGVVLSGFVGPKAFQALSAAGIQVVQNVENMTVGQAVEQYRRGEFATADAPNAQAGGPKAGA